MRTGKLVIYLLAAIGALLVVSAVVSLVVTALAILWTLLVTAVMLTALLAVCYGGYKLLGPLSGGRERDRSRGRRTHQGDRLSRTRADRAPADPAPVDPVDRAKEQYANGTISEAELEQRLERELGEGDPIDRELHRERR